jgi:peroxiredoxin
VILLLLSRLVLAGVFVVAAAAKLSDRFGLRRSMADFGVPALLVVPLGWGLVAGELAVAALLCSPAVTVGAFGATALLAVFSVLVAVTVLRGRTLDCHCFGRLSNKPVRWSTVARNALLVTVAGYVASGGREPLAFAVLAAVAACLWAGLGRRRAPVARPGVPAPDFSLADETRTMWALASVLARGTPALLVFSHPACGACRLLLPDIARWQSELQDRLHVIVVSGGPRPDSIPGSTAPGPGTVLADESGAVARAYGVQATPSAVLVDRHGRIAAVTARGAGEIADLVARQAGRSGDRGHPWLGRRSLLGVAAAGILPLVAAACGSTASARRRPKALHIDGAYLCDQRYALCTDAACVPDATDPGIVICDCVVKTGYAIGFKSCQDRAPTGSTLYSNFSTQLVTGRTRVLSCPAGAPWANCLDVVCTADPRNPAKARCQCLLVQTGPSVTFGGGCDARTCSSVIWSAATASLPGSIQLEKGMKQLGLPLTLPKSCPHK